LEYFAYGIWSIFDDYQVKFRVNTSKAIFHNTCLEENKKNSFKRESLKRVFLLLITSIGERF